MSIMKKNWTYDEVQTLIQLVKKHPSLYDRRDADYNQPRTKEVPNNKYIIETQKKFNL